MPIDDDASCRVAAKSIQGMVPQEYIGVWKRTLLKTKRGTHDTISEAYWLQTEDLHSDLRIPRSEEPHV